MGVQIAYVGGPNHKLHIFDIATHRDRTLDVAPADALYIDCSKRKEDGSCEQPITKAEPLEEALAEYVRGFTPPHEVSPSGDPSLEGSRTRIYPGAREAQRSLALLPVGSSGGGGKFGATGLEPATSGVTGRRSNQLNYAPVGETV